MYVHVFGTLEIVIYLDYGQGILLGWNYLQGRSLNTIIPVISYQNSEVVFNNSFGHMKQTAKCDSKFRINYTLHLVHPPLLFRSKSSENILRIRSAKTRASTVYNLKFIVLLWAYTNNNFCCFNLTLFTKLTPMYWFSYPQFKIWINDD